MARSLQVRRAPEAGLLLVSRQRGAATVLAIAGELDLTTAPGLQRQLTAELRRCVPLVIDLSQLAFLGIAGARALAEAVRIAGRTHVPVALVGLSPLARCVALTVDVPLFDVCHRSVPAALRQLLPSVVDIA